MCRVGYRVGKCGKFGFEKGVRSKFITVGLITNAKVLNVTYLYNEEVSAPMLLRRPAPLSAAVAVLGSVTRRLPERIQQI